MDETRLQAMEDDRETPTFAKLLDMADLYKRPVSLFYLETPPKGWQPIQDFRRLPGVEGEFSPQLTYVIRQARERREVALAIKSKLNEHVRDFALRATLATNVETLGARIREFLEISEASQQRFAKRAFEGWRAAIEAKDILVFVVPRLTLRGFLFCLAVTALGREILFMDEIETFIKAYVAAAGPNMAAIF